MISRSSKLLARAALTLALIVPASAAAATTTPRVVGGSATPISKYPWQAAVVWAGSGSATNRLFCGGVLVTPSIVLTAAHCVYDTHPALGCPTLGPGACRLRPGDVDVVLGRATLSSSDGEEFPVQATAYQPSYDPAPPGTGQNDVAYLVLAHPAPRGNAIKIAGADESALWTPGRATEISGWGSTREGGSTSDTLISATAPIISDSSCLNAYSGSVFYPGTMVCAGYLSGGVDTCNGDSGGPLQAPFQGGGYRLVGITNFGDGCARPNAPGVYARVAGATLRPAVAAEVSALESANGLPQDGVIGSGARPPGASTAKVSAVTQVVKKCRRIHNRGKRKRCRKGARRLAAGP